jgi:putative endonuclease
MGPGFESQPVHKPLLRRGFFMPFTYILFSEKLNKYYIGACIDMERRIHEHNIGHSKFTSLGMPWKIVYKKEFETLLFAKRFEIKIKKMKSRKYIEDLIGKPSW